MSVPRTLWIAAADWTGVHGPPEMRVVGTCPIPSAAAVDLSSTRGYQLAMGTIWGRQWTRTL